MTTEEIKATVTYMQTPLVLAQLIEIQAIALGQSVDAFTAAYAKRLEVVAPGAYDTLMALSEQLDRVQSYMRDVLVEEASLSPLPKLPDPHKEA